ncbi:thioredoxin domain-containing protein [Taibaiella chishuiensis]|uniref:Spermatogenesis-associated protein 20-like TRX domain-containing protein n=1 Tax=Taibaiella chishuiensis TaxID=1434707 RepID=A0A2P8CYI2_9BACT|nr:thioredoxin domain-containing protein [Taibaiella chishuiensis]PSK90034.1 hypothetical protein B0I18_10939 [Taibaiella chishuiensis]
MANRLQYESSPYLLQHAQNPVDWYPWGDEAFEKARTEHKPVLVSIGYAACHWCHVMEHESFEDPVVAAYMNTHFVCVKVDREEHPDVDHLYMDALQAMSGAGGWPLNMFVTPARQPFYGGTYFPPKALYGRNSWMQILEAIQHAWQEKQEEIALQAGQMVQHLQQASLTGSASPEDRITPEVMTLIAHNLLQQADVEEGGFGPAPKFPATGSIRFLLEYYHFRTRQGRGDALATDALQHALLCLDKMIGGGIYDQVGGGFARYATDREWLVPHFEKMLYDNALLVGVLSDAYTLTGDERYRSVIEATLSFCNRELRPATGEPGYYCALDADSEGVEGKYYTWTWQEWQELMGDAHPAIAAYYGVSEAGNWEHTNILHRAMDTGTVLQQFGLAPEAWASLLEEARLRLMARREQRIRPQTDDKILLSWNALMNTALVKAALALDRREWLDDAVTHMDWLLATFSTEEGLLLHTYKNGEARIPGKLEDYAYLLEALLQLVSATARTTYLPAAEALLLKVQEQFLHEDRNFFYFSAASQTDIIVRKVELYDGATPSANAVMAAQLWHMGNLFERSDWLEQAEALLHQMVRTVQRYPTSFACWATFMQRYSIGLKQLVLSGEGAVTELVKWQARYRPEVFALADTEGLTTGAFAGKYKAGATWCYLCAHFVCGQPVQGVEQLVL